MNEQHWSETHHEDDFEDNFLNEYEDIEDDEKDAFTRCEKCGLRLLLRDLQKHKEVKHNGQSKSS